jgi:hypothetical protein
LRRPGHTRPSSGSSYFDGRLDRDTPWDALDKMLAGTLTLKYTQPLVTQFEAIKKELGIRKTTAVDTAHLAATQGL